MRFDQRHLTFKALVALDEAAEQARAGPIEPGYAVRFALSFLFAVSDGDRSPFDAFWRQLRDPIPGYQHREVALRGRIAAIMRHVGVPSSNVDLIRLGNARSAEGRARNRAYRDVGEHAAEREEIKRRRQR